MLAIIETSPHVMVTTGASLGGIVKGCYLGDYGAQIFVVICSMLLWNKQESLTCCGCINIIWNVRSVKTDTSYHFDIWRSQCWQAMCMPEALCNVFDTYMFSSLNFLSIILKRHTFLAFPFQTILRSRYFLFQFWCAQYSLFQLEIWCRILAIDEWDSNKWNYKNFELLRTQS